MSLICPFCSCDSHAAMPFPSACASHIKQPPFLSLCRAHCVCVKCSVDCLPPSLSLCILPHGSCCPLLTASLSSSLFSVRWPGRWFDSRQERESRATNHASVHTSASLRRDPLLQIHASQAFSLFPLSWLSPPPPPSLCLSWTPSLFLSPFYTISHIERAWLETSVFVCLALAWSRPSSSRLLLPVIVAFAFTFIFPSA